MHYALVALHIRIQTAAAYEMLGKHAEAQAQLDQALTDAEPDGFVIPFAENYRYLNALLTERLQKRGYDCKCETTLHTELQQTAQAMTPLLKTEGSVPVAQYAFDVRT